MNKEKKIYVVDVSKLRLDIWLSSEIDTSRTFVQDLIKKGLVKVNSRVVVNPSFKVSSGDEVAYHIPVYEPKVFDKNDIAFKNIKIIFESDDFVVINKPPGVSTHKAHDKDEQPSISDWVYAYNIFTDNIRDNKRIGIVHRLDKDTSGIMLIARTYSAQLNLAKLFEKRVIKKTYIAVVCGKAPVLGEITYHIARSPLNPTKMVHSHSHGKSAKTTYKLIKYDSNLDLSVIECSPHTGRTHQIRVHLAAIGHPLTGDAVYGKGSKLINRHALHAHKLEFIYNEKHYAFEAKVPEDINMLYNDV